MKTLHYMLLSAIFIPFSNLIAQTATDAIPAKPKKVIIQGNTEEPKIYKLIPLATLDFKTIDVVCSPWLSKDGKIVYEEKRNSVLVYDTEYVVNKIETFIRDNDREAVNIRIDIDKIGGSSTNKTNFGIAPRRQPVVIYQNGKKITLNQPVQTIDLSSNRSSESNNSKQFIVTKSGSAASLWSGVTMVDPTWLRNQKMNPAIIVAGSNGSITQIDGTPDNPQWTNVGTSLMVLPRQLENGLIEVEVYPEISYLAGKGKRQSVKVESLSTRVRVQNGARVNIGGIISGKNKEYVNIFGPDFFKSKGFSQVMNMYLTATVLEPGKGGKFGGGNWPPR